VLTLEAPADTAPMHQMSALFAMMAGMPPEVALSPLIGRTDTVRLLADAVGLGGAPGGKVVLGGDAGVGKTRLLAELTELATTAGWRVILGHCLDFGDSALPYLPFTEAFGRLAADSPDVARSLVERNPVLERLLPTHRTLGEPAGQSTPTDRAAMFDAVQQALAELSGSSPLLLVIEDAHWADQSTRDLLTFLLTRPPTHPLAIVVSYRSDDLNRRHPLRAVLAEWHRLSAVTRLHVERLDETDVRSLIANLQPTALPEREVQRIVARAEGNPFFAEELVSAAAEDACGGLPTELADLLLVRLDRLDANGRLTVRAASVAGRQVSHDLLAHASGLHDGDLDLALRAAVEAHVLVPVAGDRYMFRHALLAEAVYDDLLPGERVRLHAAYAKALRAHDVPGTAAELARHARAAHDLVSATRASVRAGEEAMAVGGPDEAARHYELALELLADPDVATGVDEGEDSPLDRVDLVTRACAAAVSAGHIFRALALAQDQLRALSDDARPTDRVRLLLTVASTALLVDTRVDVLALSTEAVGLLPADAPAELRAQVLTMHARANADRARDDDASLWASEAQVLARQIGRLDIAVDAATTLARIDERAGDPEKSQIALVAAVAEAEASGEVSAELRSLFSLGGLHYELGRVPLALEIYQRTWQRALQARLPWGPYGLEARWMTGTAAYIAGDWDLAARAFDLTGESPPDLAEALLTAAGLEVAAAQGRFDQQQRLAGLETWWVRDGLVAILSGAAAIDLFGYQGDLASAASVHAAVLRDVTTVWQNPVWAARIRLDALLLGHLATAAAHATSDERADLAAQGQVLAAGTQQAADKADRRARRMGPEGRAWRARGRAEQARLAWLSGIDPPSEDDLVGLWREAVAGFEKFGHVYETARSRARLAAVLRATGRAGESSAEAAQARDVANRLGAEPLQSELRVLGGRGAGARAAATTPRDAALTAREEEVLALVAEGRSNSEIARTLFISAKTVSVHVSNLMAKLGAGSRTEAVAVARREGRLNETAAGVAGPPAKG
jgi:DNA-binding CsgD family transcriptional regulator